MVFQAPDVPAPADGYSIISYFPASLNRMNAYFVLSDIVPGGIPVNNAGSGVIVSIPITAAQEVKSFTRQLAQPRSTQVCVVGLAQQFPSLYATKTYALSTPWVTHSLC